MKVTAVVPSYEPDEKLIQVVDGLLAAGFDDIVVVNDGSHEGHLQPFAEAASRPGVTVLTHEVNRGKGRAMKTAFAWCVENRPDIDGVVVVDGDNQHRPKDAMAVAAAALIVGFLSMRGSSRAIRNIAITAVIASMVLLVVLTAFIIVIKIGLQG